MAYSRTSSSGKLATELGVKNQCYMAKLHFINDAALEVLRGFARVGLAACGECFLLGVIEQQVLHAEFGGELAGVERRAVRLLVGLELLAVGVEAESLAEQPVGGS